MSDKVYIVQEGENYEGLTVRGVFSSVEKAKKYLKDYLERNGRYKLNVSYYFDMSDEYILNESISYGCDYIEIREYEVK
jgi:hypothetical protein